MCKKDGVKSMSTEELISLLEDVRDKKKLIYMLGKAEEIELEVIEDIDKVYLVDKEWLDD